MTTAPASPDVVALPEAGRDATTPRHHREARARALEARARALEARARALEARVAALVADTTRIADLAADTIATSVAAPTPRPPPPRGRR